MIKCDDYILITDCNDENYLNIGQVIDIHRDYDGDIIKYEVEFARKSKVTYKYDLPEKCKVLMFRE